MTNKLDTSQVEDLSRALEGLDLRAFGVEIQAALVRSMRRQQGEIPRDTGALARSLLNRNDRAHFFEVDRDSFAYGSTLPQAEYQRHRIPLPDLKEVAQAVADALVKSLEQQR